MLNVHTDSPEEERVPTSLTAASFSLLPLTEKTSTAMTLLVCVVVNKKESGTVVTSQQEGALFDSQSRPFYVGVSSHRQKHVAQFVHCVAAQEICSISDRPSI